MWGSLALIAWTHAGYPLVAAAAASRRRYEPRRDEDRLPSVALIVAAHDEERVIRARLENALALDYPRLEVIVSLDGSTDGTRAIAEEFPGVRVLANERGGKVAAQNAAARATDADVLAFSDANSMWEPDALRRLVAVLADPEVGYVCGRLRLVDTSGGERRGPLLALRAVAARAGVAARVDHGRQRRHLRRAPLGVRRPPGHVEPRHRAPVPAPAGRAARRLRAGCGGGRAGCAHDRRRVGAQGSDAVALVGRPAAPAGCSTRAASRRRTSPRCSRTACCATRPARCTSRCSAACVARARSAASARALLVGHAAWLALALAGSARAARRLRPLLRGRDRGHRGRPRAHAARRPAGDVDAGGGHAVSPADALATRALDLVIAGAVTLVALAGARRDRDRDPAREPRPGDPAPDARGARTGATSSCSSSARWSPTPTCWAPAG